jgi:hypothetical protein
MLYRTVVCLKKTRPRYICVCVSEHARMHVVGPVYLGVNLSLRGNTFITLFYEVILLAA